METTSSGRRRIRPMKYNDFAGVQQKTPVSEAAGLAKPLDERIASKFSASSDRLANELPTTVKDSRRKRSFNKPTEQTPVESEAKRTRSHITDGESAEPRSSKRKLVLHDDDQVPSDNLQEAPAAKTNRLKRSVQRGKSVAPADDSASEKLPKRRRTTASLAMDEADSTHEDKDDESEQPIVRKRGRGRESKSALKLKEAVATPTHEMVAIPARRGRRPNNSNVAITPVATVESDTQSETTVNETRGKKVSARSLRLANRVETSTPRGRRSSRSLNAQEPVLDSPLTANDEISGDESVKSVTLVVKHGRRPRGRPAAVQQSPKAKIEVVVSDEDDDDDESHLADIFTKKGMKKRKRISPTMVKPVARASSRIAAVTLAASSPNSYGGASSDEQQPAKKQMTLPEMLRMKQTRSRESSVATAPLPVAHESFAALPAVTQPPKDESAKATDDVAVERLSRECATPTKESAPKVIATTPKLRGKRNGAQNDEYSAEADDEMEEDIKLSNRKALIQMSSVVVSLKDINVDKKLVEGSSIKTTSLMSSGQMAVQMPTTMPLISIARLDVKRLDGKGVQSLNASRATTSNEPIATSSNISAAVNEADGKSVADRQLAAVAKKTKKSKIADIKEIDDPVVAPTIKATTPPPATHLPSKSTDSSANIQQPNTEKQEESPALRADELTTKGVFVEVEQKPIENVPTLQSIPSKAAADQVVKETEKQEDATITTSLPVESKKVATSPIETVQTGDTEKVTVVPEQSKLPPKADENVSQGEVAKSNSGNSPPKKSPTKPTDKWTADSLDDIAASVAAAAAAATSAATSAAASSSATPPLPLAETPIAPASKVTPENTTSVLKFNENYKNSSASPPKLVNAQRPSAESRPNVIVDAPAESPDKSISSASTAPQEINARKSAKSTLTSAEAKPSETVHSAEKKIEPCDGDDKGSARKPKTNVPKNLDFESDSEVEGNKQQKPLKTSEVKPDEPAKSSPTSEESATITPAATATTVEKVEKVEKLEKLEKTKDSKKSVIKSVYESTAAPGVETIAAAKNDPSPPLPPYPPQSQQSPTIKQSKSLDFGQKTLPIEASQPATTSRRNPANVSSQTTKPLDEMKAMQATESKPNEAKSADANMHIKNETSSIPSARPQEPPSKRVSKDRNDAVKTGQTMTSKGQHEPKKNVSSSCSQTTMSQTDSKREPKVDAKTTQSYGAGIDVAKKFESPSKRDARQSSSAAMSMNNASSSSTASSKNSHNDAPMLNAAGTMNNSSKSMMNASMGGGGSGGGASNNASSCASNRTEKHHSKNSQDKMASSMSTIPPQFPMNQLPNYHNTHPYWQWDNGMLPPYAYHSSYNLHLDPTATQKSPTKFHKDLANTMYGHGLPSNYLAANAQSQQGAGVVQQQSFQEHQQQTYQQSAAGQQSIQQQSWNNYQNLGVINAEVILRNIYFSFVEIDFN